MSARTRFITLGALTAFLFAGASAAVLVDQTPFGTTNAYFSDGVPGQWYDQAIADDFTVSGLPVEITKITWWGASENFIFPDLTNFSSWWIRIYNDAAGLPGGQVFSLNVPKAATNPTYTGVNGTWGGHIYRQDVGGLLVFLMPGTYWLHIGSVNINPNDDAWAWSQSQNNYNNTFAFGPPGGAWTISQGGGDLTFMIEGNVIPEPATLFAVGVGLAALAARRRRKQK